LCSVTKRDSIFASSIAIFRTAWLSPRLVQPPYCREDLVDLIAAVEEERATLAVNPECGEPAMVGGSN
jgi:hypothetical protein